MPGKKNIDEESRCSRCLHEVRSPVEGQRGWTEVFREIKSGDVVEVNERTTGMRWTR